SANEPVELEVLPGAVDRPAAVLDPLPSTVSHSAPVPVVHSLSGRKDASFSIITSLFDGKLNIGMASGAVSPLDNFVSFKNVTIDLIANVLSNDSSFKVVSSPSIRMTSGVSGTFSVGQDVPVLGSVSYDGNGNAVQSVEYRSSG